MDNLKSNQYRLSNGDVITFHETWKGKHLVALLGVVGGAIKNDQSVDLGIIMGNSDKIFSILVQDVWRATGEVNKNNYIEVVDSGVMMEVINIMTPKIAEVLQGKNEGLATDTTTE